MRWLRYLLVLLPLAANAGDPDRVPYGGVGVGEPTQDGVPTGNGTTFETKILPDCDLDTQTLQYDQGSNAWTCGDDDSVANPQLVDIQGSANPCAQIQTAIGDFLIGPESGGTKVRQLIVRGQATATFSDLTDLGDHRVCIALIPSATQDANGYPLTYHGGFGTGDKRLAIDFQNARIDYDCAGQTEPAILMELGGGYSFGFDSDTSDIFDGQLDYSVTMHGSLAIRHASTCDAGWIAGRVPALPLNVNANPTTTVTMMISAFRRNSLDMLSLRISGVNAAEDNDNIGILIQGSWGTDIGEVQIFQQGVGMVLLGHNTNSVHRTYISNNHVGVSYGTPIHGSAMVTTTNCKKGGVNCGVRNGSVSNFRLQQGTVEGNPYGELFFHAASGVEINHIRTESGTRLGHMIIIGAGWCADTKLTCAVDADCPASTCEQFTEYDTDPKIRTIRWTGGAIGGDGGSVPWDHLILGEGADGLTMSQAEIESGSSRVVFNGTRVLDGNCTGVLADSTFCVGHPNSEVWMDFSNAPVDFEAKMPLYKYILFDKILDSGSTRSVFTTGGLMNLTDIEGATVGVTGGAGILNGTPYPPTCLAASTKDPTPTAPGASGPSTGIIPIGLRTIRLRRISIMYDREIGWDANEQLRFCPTFCEDGGQTDHCADAESILKTQAGTPPAYVFKDIDIKSNPSDLTNWGLACRVVQDGGTPDAGEQFSGTCVIDWVYERNDP